MGLVGCTVYLLVTCMTRTTTARHMTEMYQSRFKGLGFGVAFCCSVHSSISVRVSALRRHHATAFAQGSIAVLLQEEPKPSVGAQAGWISLIWEFPKIGDPNIVP